MTITDIRAEWHLKYTREKVMNKLPIKYKNFWVNDIIERSSARIVRFFKRTRFQSSYNKTENESYTNKAFFILEHSGYKVMEIKDWEDETETSN